MNFLFIILVVFSISLVKSVPILNNDDGIYADYVEESLFEGSNQGIRQRRVTCDLLSFKGVVGDSACAANCLSMGKAGGRCNGGVCQCRKTTFGDLWDRRFG